MAQARISSWALPDHKPKPDSEMSENKNSENVLVSPPKLEMGLEARGVCWGFQQLRAERPKLSRAVGLSLRCY